MHLYLMRHGIAVEQHGWAGAEEGRPLTQEGLERTRAVAQALCQQDLVRVDAIWTSPLTRALQTAQVMLEFFPVPLVECPALSCGASVTGLQRAFRKLHPPERFLVTGHEPDMGQLLAQLTGRTWEPFKKAGVAYVTGEFSEGKMKFQWYRQPKDLIGD